MRIIGGKYGSRPLRSLRGLELRPTSDRLRETLFNVLGPAVTGSVFVDLYAGSGAVGIEALSRGADHVVFVEKHAAAAKLIRRNLHSLGIELPGERPGGPQLVAPRRARSAEASRASTVEFPGGEPSVEVLTHDAVKALALLHRRRLLADFVFVDPPYAAAHEYERALEALSTARILAPAARVIVETARAAKRPPAQHSTANGESADSAGFGRVKPASRRQHDEADLSG
ncbi:MAG: RsmD family RNA methyltransferase, partial [Candidatus Acidiferrales bacterium]